MPTRPFCYAGLWVEGATVLSVAPGYEAYGVRPGDRLSAVNGQPFVPTPLAARRSPWESFESSFYPGDRISLTLDRNGRPATAEITCGDGHAVAEPFLAALEYSIDRQWESCLIALAQGEARTGRASPTAQIRLACIAGAAQQFGWDAQRSLEWAQAAYEYSDRVLAEARLSPETLPPRKGDLLTIVNLLETKGYRQYSDDLKAQMASASPRPEPSQTEREPGGVGIGSCFAVGRDGTVLTAHHVVAGAAEIVVFFDDGVPRRAMISAASPANDLALLKVPGAPPVFLPFAPPGAARVGQRVFTMGYPAIELLGVEPKFTDGVISALSGLGGERGLLQITVPIQPGNSGGPLVNEKGEAVGVISSMAAAAAFMKTTGALPQNVNWAVNIDFARPMLGESVRTPAKSREDAIARTKKALCLVAASMR
jgi:S1-C subfamily serine protease